MQEREIYQMIVLDPEHGIQRNLIEEGTVIMMKESKKKMILNQESFQVFK